MTEYVAEKRGSQKVDFFLFYTSLQQGVTFIETCYFALNIHVYDIVPFIVWHARITKDLHLFSVKT